MASLILLLVASRAADEEMFDGDGVGVGGAPAPPIVINGSSSVKKKNTSINDGDEGMWFWECSWPLLLFDGFIISHK